MGKFKGSFKVDQVYDPKQEAERSSSDSSSSDQSSHGGQEAGLKSDEDIEDLVDKLETPEQKKKRYRSIGITCISGFTFNIAFSLVLTSAYPYLEQMEKGCKDSGDLKAFLGYVVAAQPLAQLIFSPLVGYLGNRFGTIRYLMMITLTMLSGGFVFYSCIHALPCPRKYYLVVARLIIGAAASTTTLCYSYVAGATTVKERTMAFGLFNFAMASAFVLGPVIQAAFVSLGEDGYDMGSDLSFNLYTGPSWLAAFLALLNLFLYIPKIPIFKEYYIAEKEGKLRAEYAKKNNPEQEDKPVRGADKVAIIALLVISAFVQFNFIFMETLLTPLTLDMLGWNESQSILWVGVAFAGGGLYSGVIYGIIGVMARKLTERIVLIIGLVLLVIGPIIYLPYGGPLPPRQWNATDVEDSAPLLRFDYTVRRYENPYSYYAPENLTCWDTQSCGDGLTGCPLSQDWCDNIPATHPAQMIIGFIIICTGFPMGVALSNSIFSKVLGPVPQGTWMGLLAAGGCAARVLCPICVSNIYGTTGTWATFGFMIGIMSAVLILTLAVYTRLVPYKVDDAQTNK